ncbi:hypothetical protein [Maribacter sp. 2-571]|uniref:hypothetical protein n=1 Tax=Maribacter sp. 2-571 TaxID=3417569 RepID=UPI003D33F608
MKKTLLIVSVVVVLLFVMVKACISSIKEGVSDTFNNSGSSKTEKAFFKNLDLSDGSYAFLVDKDGPPVLIDDPQILSDNLDKIKTDVSWLSYLPGEGGGANGIRVFKDNRLVHARLARSFKTFQVGNLREYGRPVTLKSIYVPKARYLQQKDSLEKRSDVFISRATEVPKDAYDYRFTLYCPPILVSEKDTVFDAWAYGQAFAQRIADGLSNLERHGMGTNAANSTQPEPLLVLKRDGATHYLRNAETNNTLPLRGYVLHGSQLVFRCNMSFYNKIRSHNFTPYFQREGLSEEEIKDLIREKIGPDNAFITLDAVYASMFSERFKVGKALQNKYDLQYFELLGAKQKE